MRICSYYFICIILSNILGMFLMGGDFLLFVGALIVLMVVIILCKISLRHKGALIILSFINFMNMIVYYSPNEKVFKDRDFRIIRKFNEDVMVSSGRERYLIRDFREIDKIDLGKKISISGRILGKKYYDIGARGEIEDYVINSTNEDFYYFSYYLRDKIRERFINDFGESRGGV